MCRGTGKNFFYYSFRQLSRRLIVLLYNQNMAARLYVFTAISIHYLSPETLYFISLLPHEEARQGLQGLMANTTITMDAADLTPIRIIRERIGKKELRDFLDNPFPDMVKFAADVDSGIIALGGELNADAEQILLEEGCRQRSIWGGTIYPDASPGKKIEYTALINIRSSQDNRGNGKNNWRSTCHKGCTYCALRPPGLSQRHHDMKNTDSSINK
jgi:hypothetical protein